MSQQPYYFEVVPRNILSKTFEKQQGQFRFHIYKTTQRVDFSKEPYQADFNSQNKMKIANSKLNFFLPNYFAGKNANAKFIFELSKKSKYYDQKSVGSYTIDPNVYVEEFKRNGTNHFAQLWSLSDDYSVQIQFFFDESKYLLEKILREYRSNPAANFSKPIISKALQEAQKVQVDQQHQYDNEERYNQKRLQLLNKYAGAIIGQGGYRIFDEEEESNIKKQTALKGGNKKQEQIKIGEKLSIEKTKKPVQQRKSITQNQNNNDKPVIRRTESTLLEDENSQNPHQIKNLKFLIIGIIILILLGSGYFLSKIFLKEQSSSVQIPKIQKPKKSPLQGTKKPKAKSNKKSKKPQQL